MVQESVSSAMPAADNTVGATYRVLARKHRPTTFAQLIGQDAMVRTLTNAFASGRVAQAFMLTGVRGVGKTTTARIIARALNCVGPDGQGGPTATPCGVCDNCVSIAEDRHVDVLEMDAASRTGIDNMRELLDGVRYRPTTARYKVYILDEIHMLSDKAFNALLKTLEEPPAHVKFIFATTEIRKVPVTVLSRCQRFDLRRIDIDTLTKLYTDVAGAEGVEIAPAALALIARAADGSARDGLSLLDQAIARAEGPVTEADVRDMLGLADRTQLFDLYDLLMRGDAKGALDLMGALYTAGADPAVVVQDLLELTHWLTRIKLVPQAAEAPGVPEAERVRGGAMAGKLSTAQLARIWQMLLKGLAEVQTAPMPLQAAEMVLIRLTHAAGLPTPADLVRQIQNGGDAANADRPPSAGAADRPGTTTAIAGPSMQIPRPEPTDLPSPAEAGFAKAGRPRAVASGGSTALAQPETVEAAPNLDSFAAVVALLAERREAILQAHLKNNVHLVRFEPGRIEIRPDEHAPRTLANRLGALLSEWTGRRWVVAISSEPGEPTLAQQEVAADQRERAEVTAHPLVQAVMSTFPGATIDAIRDLTAAIDTPTEGDPEA
jgi:DNA polymerase-3 subunit gamma/tau